MSPINILLFRLLIVVIVGGLIGVERELKSKSAGFRTLILIRLGTFLFTTFSIHISPQASARIASNIVTGIGFIGAGVIFKDNNKINGLTSAATIWVTAALGMGVAGGNYAFVITATSVVFFSLLLLPKTERWIDKIRQFRTYTITTQYQVGIVPQKPFHIFSIYSISLKHLLSYILLMRN